MSMAMTLVVLTTYTSVLFDIWLARPQTFVIVGYGRLDDPEVNVEQNQGDKGAGAPDKELTLTIETVRGAKSFTFPKTAKVREVIEAAVAAFALAPGDKYDLMLATDLGSPLQPDRPLVSYHLKDGDKLVLSSVGGGV